jgi:hypothetical protein
MHSNAQLARRPVVSVLPAISDIVERVAQFNRDLLGCDPDVDFVLPPQSSRRPDVAVQAGVQVAQEVVGKQIVKQHGAVENGGQKFLGYLLLHGLLKVINVGPGDGLGERLDDVGKQRGQFIVGKRCLSVPGRQRGQGRRACRSARRRCTPTLRTCPAGICRSSSFAEALVARAATFFTTAFLTGAFLPLTFLTAAFFAVCRCMTTPPPENRLPAHATDAQMPALPLISRTPR